MHDEPVLDPRPLQELVDMGAGDDLLPELIQLCREDVPVRIEAISRGLASGDRKLILSEAHQLKGALGNLGLRRFAGLASRLEEAAGEGPLDGLAPLVAALPTAFQEALAALEAAFPRS